MSTLAATGDHINEMVLLAAFWAVHAAPHHRAGPHSQHHATLALLPTLPRGYVADVAPVHPPSSLPTVYTDSLYISYI